MKSGNLNFLEPSGLLRACNGTDLPRYVPVEGKEQDTEEFYRELQNSMDKIPKKEYVILVGDFNGRIGNQPNPECIGPYGE